MQLVWMDEVDEAIRSTMNDDMRKLCDKRGAFVAAVYDEDGLAGYGVFNEAKSVEGTAVLDYLYADDKYRDRGYYGEFFEKITAAVKDRGYKYVTTILDGEKDELLPYMEWFKHREYVPLRLADEIYVYGLDTIKASKFAKAYPTLKNKLKQVVKASDVERVAYNKFMFEAEAQGFQVGRDRKYLSYCFVDKGNILGQVDINLASREETIIENLVDLKNGAVSILLISYVFFEVCKDMPDDMGIVLDETKIHLQKEYLKEWLGDEEIHLYHQEYIRKL